MNKGKDAAANVPTQSEKQASASRINNEASTSTDNMEKNKETGIVRGSTDFSRIPIPVCSCTGVPRECQKLSGGWRSKCCTARLSEYPLPFSSRRKGRMLGRRMSKGAFKKLIERLAAEGHDLLRGIDLKDHWRRYEKRI